MKWSADVAEDMRRIATYFYVETGGHCDDVSAHFGTADGRQFILLRESVEDGGDPLALYEEIDGIEDDGRYRLVDPWTDPSVTPDDWEQLIEANARFCLKLLAGGAS